MNCDLENTTFYLLICHGPWGAAPADPLPLSGPDHETFNNERVLTSQQV